MAARAKGAEKITIAELSCRLLTLGLFQNSFNEAGLLSEESSVSLPLIMYSVRSETWSKPVRDTWITSWDWRKIGSTEPVNDIGLSRGFAATAAS